MHDCALQRVPHAASSKLDLSNQALCLYRWDGLRQAFCLHKCLHYFVHDNQIWVRMDHLLHMQEAEVSLFAASTDTTVLLTQVKTLQCFVLNGFIFLGRCADRQLRVA